MSNFQTSIQFQHTNQKHTHYKAIKLYNKLPITIKQQETIKQVKNKMNNFLDDKVYYSIDKYLEDAQKDCI